MQVSCNFLCCIDLMHDLAVLSPYHTRWHDSNHWMLSAKRVHVRSESNLGWHVKELGKVLKRIAQKLP